MPRGPFSRQDSGTGEFCSASSASDVFLRQTSMTQLRDTSQSERPRGCRRQTEKLRFRSRICQFSGSILPETTRSERQRALCAVCPLYLQPSRGGDKNVKRRAANSGFRDERGHILRDKPIPVLPARLIAPRDTPSALI